MALSQDPTKRDTQMVRLKAMKAGMTEDQYKDWLQAQFGVRSATELSERQRRQAHGRLHKLLDAGKPQSWNEPQVRKLRVLWGMLAERGAVQVKTEDAMEAWAKRRIPGLDALRFARSEELQHLIESAKKWLLRVDPEVDLTL
ncbi:regulatory protein GemA [Pandoraea pnomenusa]|uniref:regulatory protein GemA n=1 Tax=Pandoraea pnomenusa TaxID=93220 RepID=UPI00333E2EB2